MPKSTTKRTLMSIRQQTTITTQQLAQAAGVPLRETYTVEIGGFTDELTAHKVMHAFTQLSGNPLQREDLVLNNDRQRQRKTV